MTASATAPHPRDPAAHTRPNPQAEREPSVGRSRCATHDATARHDALCWFIDPARALCLKLAGTPTADRPLVGMCDSARCPQATHHPCHRPVWAEQAERTKIFLGQLGTTRKTERTRLKADYDRSLRVVAEIDAASTTMDEDSA
jgi:hypothetical protein